MARSLSKPGPCRCSIGPPPDTLSDRCMQVAIDFSIAATTDPCHAAPCPTAACKSQSISASRLPPILFMEHASRNQLPANRFQHRGYPRSISCSTLPGRCMQVAIGFSIALPPEPFRALSCSLRLWKQVCTRRGDTGLDWSNDIYS